MAAHDRNHIYAKLDGQPNFFIVVDLIEQGFAARGVAAKAHFHQNESSGRYWMHFAVNPGTREEIPLSVYASSFIDWEEIQNLKVEKISGPGTEQSIAAVRDLLKRYGGEWEERDYYSADKIELPKIEKTACPAYEPSRRVRAAVSIADGVGFDGMENLLDLLEDRKRSAAYARLIMDYGLVKFGMHDVGPDPRALYDEDEAAPSPK